MEEHIIIGSDRHITVPETLKKIAVQFDHNAETVTFDCPRYWDEHDLSKMAIYVNYMRPDETVGAHLCDNVVIDRADNDIMHFDWTISGHVTEMAGPLSFLVCIRDVDSEGNEKAHWNTELNTDMWISSGMRCRETILRKYPDIITQLLLRMDQSEAIVAAAKESAEIAKASAESAKSSATEAEASSATATTSADAAKTSANAAQASATSATSSASAAKTSETNASNSATAAAGSASSASTYASNASSSASAAKTSETNAKASETAAKTAQAAAEAARDAASEIAGGDFASKTEAQGYANIAESNAKSYTDQKIAAIPTPDVSGQINTHNTDTTAHADIRELIANAGSGAGAAIGPDEPEDATLWVDTDDDGGNLGIANGGDQVFGNYTLEGNVDMHGYLNVDDTHSTGSIRLDGSSIAIFGSDGGCAHIGSNSLGNYEVLDTDGIAYVRLVDDNDDNIRIRGVQDPRLWFDAANKQYVDSKIAYGTTEVEAGSASTYPEGTLYVVIE